jgi:hypothetical protein
VTIFARWPSASKSSRRNFTAVLGGCGLEEFIAGVAKTTQSKPAQREDVLEMRQQHLSFFHPQREMN